jgi:hypothetical protein
VHPYAGTGGAPLNHGVVIGISDIQRLFDAAVVGREWVVTYFIMALGALGVTLLAGLTGAMPSPRLRDSGSDETMHSEPDIDLSTKIPASDDITPPPQLPPEILDALAEGRRLGRVTPKPSHDGNGVQVRSQVNSRTNLRSDVSSPSLPADRASQFQPSQIAVYTKITVKNPIELT